MSTAKFCTQCGAKINQGDKFCKSCGARISDSGASEPRPKNPVPQVKEELHLTRDGLYRGKKKKTFEDYFKGCLLVLVATVIGFIAIIFFYIYASEIEQNKPSKSSTFPPMPARPVLEQGQNKFSPQPTPVPLDSRCYSDNSIKRCVESDLTHEEKIVEFSYIILRTPEFRPAYYHRGAAYLELRQYEKSLADFNRAIEMGYSAETELYGKLGHVQRALDNHKEALLSYEKHKELDPSNAWPYHYIGKVHFDLEEYEKAIESWELYAEMRQLNGEYPSYRSAHERIGQAYLELGLFSKALESFNIAIEGDPNPEAHLLKLKEEAESKIQK